MSAFVYFHGWVAFNFKADLNHSFQKTLQSNRILQ